MKTLIYGAGPIGQWLALQLHSSDADVSLLARMVGPELLELAEEFAVITTLAGR